MCACTHTHTHAHVRMHTHTHTHTHTCMHTHTHTHTQTHTLLKAMRLNKNVSEKKNAFKKDLKELIEAECDGQKQSWFLVQRPGK